jgi:transposase
VRGDRTGAEVVQRRLLEAALIRGLLTNEEWACFEPFMVEAGPSGGRPPRDHRRNLDAILWIARTGAPWRDLPPELGNWNSVHPPTSEKTTAARVEGMIVPPATTRAFARISSLQRTMRDGPLTGAGLPSL